MITQTFQKNGTKYIVKEIFKEKDGKRLKNIMIRRMLAEKTKSPPDKTEKCLN
jgi:hypothetical protein